jgi:hypothetical protein
MDGFTHQAFAPPDIPDRADAPEAANRQPTGKPGD